MINLYTSSTQDGLVEHLAQAIQTRAGQLFRPTFILTPGIAQDNWLKEQLANELGIVANLRLQRINRFLGWLEFLFSDHTQPAKFTNEQLVWVIFDWMGKPDFRQKFEELDKYYDEDEIKRLALAEKLVRLFDKYQDYRGEMFSGWNNLDSADWQEYIYANLKDCFDSRFANKSQRIQFIREALGKDTNQELMKNELGTLYVFGSISLTPVFLELIELIGKFIPVHIFRSDLGIFNSESSIALNWGNSNKNAIKLLSELENVEVIEITNKVNPVNSLLTHVQKNIQTNDPILIKSTDLLSDFSLEFHSCHTRIREVESLYNYLIRLGEKQEEFSSRRCLVFIPSLDQYVGPIKTVFDTAPLKFPYQFVTGAYSREESFWSALDAVLAFEQEDFTAPNFFQLVELNAIKEGIGFQDLELLRKMIAKAGIRRDFEGDLELETRYQSWEYGLKRLMYGFLMGENDLLYNDGIDEFYTRDAVEGTQTDELIRLIYLTNLIQGILEKKRSKKPLNEWLAMTSQLAEELLKPVENEFAQLQRLIAQFGISDDLRAEPIAFNTFFYRFSELLNSMEIHQIKGFGGITFSELSPGRVIPAETIAFMGMNFGEFPRKDSPVSFDKMNSGEKQPLDPNSRITDQGVFLEALIHAEKSVFISYLGQSDKDNKELPASTVVEELLDLISGNNGIDRKELILKHPLHSESSSYNQQDKTKLKNFLIREHEAIDLNKTDPGEELIGMENQAIRIADLELFLKDPIRYYYNRNLGVYYGDRRESLHEAELFGLDNLEKWSIKDHLLFSDTEDDLEPHKEEQDMQKVKLEQQRLELVRKGKIPLRNSGVQELESLLLEMAELKNFFNGMRQPIKTTITVQLNALGSISGEVSILPDGSGIYYTVSKDKPKYRISALIHFLLLRESGNKFPFHYLTINGGNQILGNFESAKLKSDLNSLIEHFVKNKNRKTPFCSESTRPMDNSIQGRSKEGFREALENEMGNREFSEYFFPSDYFVREYEADFFENDAVLEELFDNHALINEILKSYFA
jgi:exodeoxyribonuclease V gamma subunit